MLPCLSLKEILKTPVEFNFQAPDGRREWTPARYSLSFQSGNALPARAHTDTKYNFKNL